MSTSKIAIIRGSSINKWEMQNFEPLASRWDITACVSQNNAYSTKDITLPFKTFRSASSRFDSLGAASRAAARLGFWKRPEDRLVGLEEWLKTSRIAHVAETSLASSEQAVAAKQSSDVKVVVTCWETIPYAYEEDAAVHQRCEAVRLGADLFLPTTRRAARALTLAGVPASKIEVVMPGVDTARFVPRESGRDPEFAARYGLEGDEIVLLFTGRLIREKGVRELVVAYSLLLRDLPQGTARRCRLLIAGRGDQTSFIETLLRETGTEQQARIVGGLDYREIHRLHQLADVFVLPSIASPYWEEQYGMVLAEAMACGVPPVSTSTGGIPEVVGEAGLLVPPLEPEALADALKRLICDGDYRRALGASARQRAVKDLSAAQTADAFSKIYSRLTKQESAPRPPSPLPRPMVSA